MPILSYNFKIVKNVGMDMNKIKLGFIGFGEAAYHISKGLMGSAAQLVAYDIKADDPEVGELIRKRAQSTQVQLVPSLEQLIERSEIILSLTSAKYALNLAEECAPFLKNDHYYVDLNAASPIVMREIEAILGAKALFVDGAIMEAVPPHLHKVPILLSGPNSDELKDKLNALGMNMTVISEKPGDASAIKMFRSIFMKGFTMLLIETLTASHKFGVDEMIIESLEQTLKKPLGEMVNLLITRTAIHAERRLSEMEQVMDTLKEMKLDYTMSEATRNKLQTLVDLELSRHFNFEAPEHYTEVLNQL